MTIQSRRCGLERRERQARDKAVSDAKIIQKTAPEHRWGGRTIFAKVVREGKAMIHSSRRDRKAKAIAEVLAMIANAQASLAPHRPRLHVAARLVEARMGVNACIGQHRGTILFGHHAEQQEEDQ